MNREKGAWGQGNTYTNLFCSLQNDCFFTRILFHLFISVHVCLTVWFNEITDLYSDDLLFLKYFYGVLCWHFQPMVRTKTNEKISRTYITPIDAPYFRTRFIEQPENKTEKKSKDIKQSRGKRRNRLVWVRNEIPLDFCFLLWRFYLQYNHLLLLVLNKVICIFLI